MGPFGSTTFDPSHKPHTFQSAKGPTMVDQPQPRVAFLVKFASGLPPEEAQRRYRERMPRFREVPGLVQKYYLRDEATGEWGGLYLFDAPESLEGYLASDLRRTIAETYDVQGQPLVQRLAIVDVLRS